MSGLRASHINGTVAAYFPEFSTVKLVEDNQLLQAIHNLCDMQTGQCVNFLQLAM